MLAPIASFGLAGAVIAGLLVGFGGQHSATPIGQTLDSSAKLGPLSAPAALNTDWRHVHSWDSSSTTHRRAAAVPPFHFTEPSKTVVTHPTPTTTVTTVTTTTVKPTEVTTVTTVTTVTVHPGTTTPPSAVSQTTTPAPATTTTVRTTTTTTPMASGNAGAPNAPASLGAPTNLVLADDFNTGSLNTTLWSPSWYGNSEQQNQTTMSTSNVAVGASGLALTDAANNTGGIVSSNPHDSQAGHTGFQIAPSAGKPVYVEWQATLPAAANGSVANWPALWLVGQSPWPENGEIDVMEGLGGSEAYHIHFGDGSGSGADGPGAPAMSSPGTHTFGVMWTTTSINFVYDGKVVGTENESLDSPMFIVMENSIGDYGGPTTLPATETVRYVKVWQ